MRAVRDVCGLVGCGGRKTTRSTIIIIELQLQAASQGEGESKNYKNGEKMPHTLMSTLADCYFVYV
jgi:hypothetical protein